MKSPYLEIPTTIAKLFQNFPTARTGAPVTSVAGALNFVTHRMTTWNQVISVLPCVYVDVDPTGINYEHYDQGVDRLIPVMIMVYIPISTRGDVEATADTKDIEADEDIKTVFGDLEEVLNSGAGQLGVVHSLELVGGGIAYEPWQGGDEVAGIRIRVGVLACVARSKVR